MDMTVRIEIAKCKRHAFKKIASAFLRNLSYNGHAGPSGRSPPPPQIFNDQLTLSQQIMPTTLSPPPGFPNLPTALECSKQTESPKLTFLFFLDILTICQKSVTCLIKTISNYFNTEKPQLKSHGNFNKMEKRKCFT